MRLSEQLIRVSKSVVKCSSGIRREKVEKIEDSKSFKASEEKKILKCYFNYTNHRWKASSSAALLLGLVRVTWLMT